MASEKLYSKTAQVTPVDGGAVVRRGTTHLRIAGNGVADIVQFILVLASEDGTTRDEIVAMIQARIPTLAADAIGNLIDALVTHGIVVPATQPIPGDGSETTTDIFYWSLGAAGEKVHDGFADARIVLLGVNAISRRLAGAIADSGRPAPEVVDIPMLRNLAFFVDAGGTVRPDAWPAACGTPVAYDDWKQSADTATIGCLVGTCDFGGQSLLRDWNKFAVDAGIPFLPVVLQDFQGTVGPLVIPGETACLECLRARENAIMDDPDAVRLVQDDPMAQAAAGFHPSMAGVLGDVAQMEIMKFIAGRSLHHKPGQVVRVDLLRPEISTAKVLKVPRCRVCGATHTESAISLDVREMYVEAQEQ